MPNLTRKEMEDVIKSGESVSYRGKIISDTNDLPSENELSALEGVEITDSDVKRIAKNFQTQIDLLVSGQSVNIDKPLEPVNSTSVSTVQALANVPTDESKGLGRLVALDFRDAKHLISAKLPQGQVGLRYKFYHTGAVLDQGDTSHCVAYSGEQFLVSGPVTNKFYANPADLYKECQKNDEWEGEEPLYSGTSVRALFKVLQSHRYIKEYTWAFDIDSVVQHLLKVGPVIFGTNWYNSMFYPDAITGFITVIGSSGLAGGHAYMIKGVNLDKLCPDGSRGALRIINSWSKEWGQDGLAWISLKDASRLIKELGEAGTATEIKFAEEKKG
jgi:hypothetical protein